MQTLSPAWRKAPFIRLLVPLIAGILLQWSFQINVAIPWLVLLVALITLIIFFFIPILKRFRFSSLNGIMITFIFLSVGSLLAGYKDIRNDKQWLGNFYKEDQTLLVTLEEPPVEKTKSLKCDAAVNELIEKGHSIKVKGRIIIYFRKDSLLPPLTYGSQIIFSKSLQEIKNPGNPGSFDYKRYALFQGITHQVYLKPGEFVIPENKNKNWLDQFLFATREKIVSILRNYIPGEKAQGLAEALLIGYKNDLDKTLVQSYTNTGVVHIIAISGMHLALVYWLLLKIFSPLKKRKNIRWLRPVLIIAGLWLFSLLAGAQASVLRSALMFSCLVTGESISRKTSIFNTLAVSAFILLCYNPFWLWDVGFQLSYAAVLSIVIFMQPVYHLFYIQNKILDFIWKLNAVTIAAQILTVPISLYHFHQFPNYFLLTNFVAVPLSGIIVLGEILLCTVSFLPFIAIIAGQLLSWLIGLMNSCIERIESLPYSLWDGLQVSLLQAILLTIAITGFSFWMMEKIKAGFKIGLVALLVFVFLRSISFIQAGRQQKIIVYNVPQRQAIDIIEQREYFFIGDQDLVTDDFIRNFHLKPSRILHRIAPSSQIPGLWQSNKFLVCHSKKILLLDSTIFWNTSSIKTDIDLLILSKNPAVKMKNLANNFNIKQVVFDGSASFWKINSWKKDCDSLHIPYHDVNEKGAFVMSLR